MHFCYFPRVQQHISNVHQLMPIVQQLIPIVQYTHGATAYMLCAAAYMVKVRIKLTQSSCAGAGTELGNKA